MGKKQAGRNWCIPAAVAAALQDLGTEISQEALMLAYCKKFGASGLRFAGSAPEVRIEDLDDEVVLALAEDADLPHSNFETMAEFAQALTVGSDIHVERKTIATTTPTDLKDIDWERVRVVVAGKPGTHFHAYVIRGVCKDGCAIIWDPHNGRERSEQWGALAVNGDALVIRGTA